MVWAHEFKKLINQVVDHFFDVVVEYFRHSLGIAENIENLCYDPHDDRFDYHYHDHDDDYAYCLPVDHFNGGLDLGKIPLYQTDVGFGASKTLRNH